MRRNHKLGTMAIATAAAVLLIPATALAGTTTPKTTTAATTSNLQIPLTPTASFAKATGTAQYQAQPGQREFQVEATHLRSLAGRSVLVQVNGTNVGSAKVSRTGIAQLTRNTEVGQSVPSITHGATVTLKTSATGATIASGTF